MIQAACSAELGESKRTRSAGLALAGLSVSMLMSSLNTSIANSSLPTLAKEFGASFQQVQWIVLAYLLAITSLIVGIGRLGDLAGRRRLLLTGIFFFTVASVLCGIVTTFGLLVAGRVTQGLGAAAMMALTIAFVGDTVPKEKIGSAMGLLGTMSAIGTALGPSVGGFLITGFGWRAIFLVNLPLGLIAAFLVYRHLPVDRPMAKADGVGFDHWGTLLLASTLVSYALAMTLGRGSFGPLNAMLLLGAAAGAGLFLFVESKVNSPLVRLAMFRDSTLRGGLAMSALVSTVMMATLVVGPFYLSRTLGLNAAQVGLTLSIGPLVAALGGVPSGRIVDRFGAGRIAIAGLSAMALGVLLVSLTSQAWGVLGFIGPLVVATAGYAFFQTANNTAVMAGISTDRRGVVSGMLNLSRNLGLITGTSVMGALFAFAAQAADITTAHPLEVARGMKVAFAVATALVAVALAIAIASGRATRSPNG